MVYDRTESHPMSRTFSSVLGVCVLALGAAACGGGDSATATTSAAAVTTTAIPGIVKTTDLVYMTIDGSELLMDVYTPAGDGPWPVVVAFHGLSNAGKGDFDNVVVAEEAADQGMVVFAPTWIAGDPFPITIDVFEMFKDSANCAVAFAQENAINHGGDPANTVVYGFSAGAGAALLATVQPTEGQIAGCESGASPTPISGAVLGDGEYLIYTEGWDSAFEADLEAMQGAVASMTDASHWPPDLDTRFILWVAKPGTSPRTFGDPSDNSGWLGRRDSDGSIRVDLDRLDQLEDRTITFVDAGQLLELRLNEAGIIVTLDQLDGGHTTAGKVPELVGYLKAAAAQ
jgi:dienelactone hydrolase